MRNKKIRLPKVIYPENVIKRAVRDYQGICQITCLLTGDAYVCTITNSKADLELTANEFMNYLVEVVNSGGA